ncbi:hypothetical protein P4O66_000582 [Electrophorus voltai]|uniref:Activin types I and II receptor domain-containing protein n=1 Tax=Electrophorus voltai TaxID=2609070 RepID=A0AAD8ZFG5_9TELE|nr:hypothetical protein P4O66_000582 [Electrophorus voltai]
MEELGSLAWRRRLRAAARGRLFQSTPNNRIRRRFQALSGLRLRQSASDARRKQAPPAQREERECAYAEQQQAMAERIGGGGEGRVFLENSTIRCSQGGWCYGLWEKKQHGVRLVKQGCWTYLGDQQECHDNRCQVTNPPSQIQNGTYRFCCCSRDMCNLNFTEDFPLPRPTTSQPVPFPLRAEGKMGSVKKETKIKTADFKHGSSLPGRNLDKDRMTPHGRKSSQCDTGTERKRDGPTRGAYVTQSHIVSISKLSFTKGPEQCPLT